MSSFEDFKGKFYAARTQIEKVKLCIQEGRYKIVTRRDKPNLNGAEYLKPILELPADHPHKIKQKESAVEDGRPWVIDFEYKATIMGNEMTIYFKGFFTKDGTLELKIQSLRNEKDA